MDTVSKTANAVPIYQAANAATINHSQRGKTMLNPECVPDEAAIEALDQEGFDDMMATVIQAEERAFFLAQEEQR